MIRLPRACHAYGWTAVWFPTNSSHMCCVELARKALASAGKGFPRLCHADEPQQGRNSCRWLQRSHVWRLIDCFALDAGFPRTLTWRLCQAVGPQQGRNSCLWLPLRAWYGCAHAWGTGPAVRWSIGAPCLDLHYFQCNRIKFNLFFINYCISRHF